MAAEGTLAMEGGAAETVAPPEYRVALEAASLVVEATAVERETVGAAKGAEVEKEEVVTEEAMVVAVGTVATAIEKGVVAMAVVKRMAAPP